MLPEEQLGLGTAKAVTASRAVAVAHPYFPLSNKERKART
jgi:hypothetical protein